MTPVNRAIIRIAYQNRLTFLGNLAKGGQIQQSSARGCLTAGAGQVSSALTGIKVEQDRPGEPPQIKIPLPPKETLTMIADVIREFAKRL